MLENVVLDGANAEPDFANTSRTENTRAAYPLEALASVAPGSRGGEPKTVVFLTADAFGVLPLISRLTPDQAYHFLSGYTAKVAGTELGLTEPTATFSACFGAALHVAPSARLCRTAARTARCIGSLDLAHQHGLDRRRLWCRQAHRYRHHPASSGRRAVRRACRCCNARLDPHFGLAVPVAVDGVRPETLDPRAGWHDAGAYAAAAQSLAGMFEANFRKFETQGAVAA